VLATYPQDLSKKAEHALLRLGARVRTGLMVTCIDGGGVTLKDKSGHQEHIASHTVIWAAGVGPSDFAQTLAKRTSAATEKGRIKVNPDLTIPGYPDIFVVGDSAYSLDQHGKPLPGVAQVAMQGGEYAAKTIVKRVRGQATTQPFRYFNKGDLAVIGRGKAVANVFGFHLAGFPAWLVWVFIHLLYIVEFQSRVLVLLQWGFLYLTFNRGALLTTGKAAEASVSGAARASTTAQS
jgi:NADH dehydrogenase